MSNKYIAIIGIGTIVAFVILMILFRLISLRNQKMFPMSKDIDSNKPTLFPTRISLTPFQVIDEKSEDEPDINTNAMFFFDENESTDKVIYPDVVLANAYFTDPQDISMNVISVDDSSSSASFRFEVYYSKPEHINKAHYDFLNFIKKSGLETSLDDLDIEFVLNEDLYKKHLPEIPQSKIKTSTSYILGIEDTKSLSIIKLLIDFLDLFSSENVPTELISLTPIPYNSPAPSVSIGPQPFNGLDYNIPIRDTSVRPISIDEFKERVLVKSPWKGAQIQYYDYINTYSISRGWNPAFIMTIWVEETGGSHTTLKSVGGGGLGWKRPDGKVVFSSGHVGCAPREKQFIKQSLDCIFNNFGMFNNHQFAEFMYLYSGDDPAKGFIHNPNFPKNIKIWYGRLTNSNI